MKDLLLMMIRDPIILPAGLVALGLYFGFIRRRKIIYGKDGISYDPNTLTFQIYDFRKYFQDSVHKKNLEKNLAAIKEIPLGVPLDDNLQPIDRKKQITKTPP